MKNVIHVDFANMTRILKNPPNRLREQRKKRGLTLTDVATRIGMNVGYLSKLEVGDRELRMDHLRRIAAVYAVEVGELLNNQDNSASLDDTERMVIEAMRTNPLFAHSVATLAEAQSSYRPAPEIAAFKKQS